MTTPRDEREILRFLHGELSSDEEAAFRRRLEEDPALRIRTERLKAVWDGLELPPPEAVEPGFPGRVRVAVEAGFGEGAGADAWSGRRRLVAAAALAAGIAVGFGVGQIVPVDELSTLGTGDGTLAESYWELVAAETGGEAP